MILRTSSTSSASVFCLLAAIFWGGGQTASAQQHYPERVSADRLETPWIEKMDMKAGQTQLDKELRLAKRKRQPTEKIEEAQARLRKAQTMLSATDKILVVDSVVVPKQDFLKAYLLTPQMGALTLSDGGKTVCYTTERANTRFRAVAAADSAHTLTLVREDKDGGVFSSPRALQGLGVHGDANYPFLMPDGQTLYFAARTDEGLGNYDLYVTRYDSDNDSFYPAENLGYPYNSTANDYMLVINEPDRVGWFASDRFQPDDKVCIYTFVPNASRNPVDEELADDAGRKALASLRPIKATWNDGNAQERIRIRQVLAQLSATLTENVRKHDFEFVINDIYTYTTLEDFHSPAARQHFKEMQEKEKDYRLSQEKLDLLRSQYHSAKQQQRQSLAPQILRLEEQNEQLLAYLHDMAKRIRAEELGNRK